MNEEYLRWVIQKYQIDFVVHGDDPCIVDGRDVYESAQALGKYRTIPRTEGVSTTEIVGRMLLMSKGHHQPIEATAGGEETAEEAAPSPVPPTGIFVRESNFMTTSRMLGLFATTGKKKPSAAARVVYVDGAFDMFNSGHVDFLAAAAALGDYLLVGVHCDAAVNRRRGRNFPIMNINERVLSVLACRHTGDVVIAPPWHMTREMIAALNISVVAHGTIHDPNDDGSADPYEVPKKLGIFTTIPSRNTLNVYTIMQRIQDNHERVAAKVQRKMVGEHEYYAARYGLDSEPTDVSAPPS